MTGPRETFRPDPADRSVYRGMVEVYESIRGHTDAVYERTYPIFH